MISSSHAPLRDAASSTTPMMSLSFATTKSSPSILISVPDHFPNSTRSPTLTSSGCSLPSSPREPGPAAMTSPSIGFSLAVSGMMMPPLVFSSSSMRRMRTRSCNGRNFIGFLPSLKHLKMRGWLRAPEGGERMECDVRTFKLSFARMPTHLVPIRSDCARQFIWYLEIPLEGTSKPLRFRRLAARAQFCRPVRMPPADTPIPPRCGSCQNPDPRAATKFATNHPGAAAGLGARSRARTFAEHRRAAQGTMALSREELLMKLGAARDQSRTAWRLVTIEVAADSATFSYRLDCNRLRQTRLREGRYLLRTNLVEEDPAKL